MDKHIQDLLESELKEREYPDFDPGDTICVQTREEIGGQMRDRKFEGVCIGRSGKGPDQTFKVRKDSFGTGVERIFPLYSPMIEDIEVIQKGKVRRAKLNYLEERSSKEARIEEERADLEAINRVEQEPTEETAEETSDQATEEQSEADEQAEEHVEDQETDEPSEEDAQDDEGDEVEDESENPPSNSDGSAEEDESSGQSDQEEDTEATPEADSAESAEDENENDESKEEVGESV